jgi:hypothetical protein
VLNNEVAKQQQYKKKKKIKIKINKNKKILEKKIFKLNPSCFLR